MSIASCTAYHHTSEYTGMEDSSSHTHTTFWIFHICALRDEFSEAFVTVEFDSSAGGG